MMDAKTEPDLLKDETRLAQPICGFEVSASTTPDTVKQILQMQWKQMVLRPIRVGAAPDGFVLRCIQTSWWFVSTAHEGSNEGSNEGSETPLQIHTCPRGTRKVFLSKAIVNTWLHEAAVDVRNLWEQIVQQLPPLVSIRQDKYRAFFYHDNCDLMQRGWMVAKLDGNVPVLLQVKKTRPVVEYRLDTDGLFFGLSFTASLDRDDCKCVLKKALNFANSKAILEHVDTFAQDVASHLELHWDDWVEDERWSPLLLKSEWDALDMSPGALKRLRSDVIVNALEELLDVHGESQLDDGEVATKTLRKVLDIFQKPLDELLLL